MTLMTMKTTQRMRVSFCFRGLVFCVCRSVLFKLSSYQSIHLSIHPSFHSSVCQFIFLYLMHTHTCLSIGLLILYFTTLFLYLPYNFIYIISEFSSDGGSFETGGEVEDALAPQAGQATAPRNGRNLTETSARRYTDSHIFLLFVIIIIIFIIIIIIVVFIIINLFLSSNICLYNSIF
jgi:hypothetical protein